MRILLDESVSLRLADVLRKSGHQVTAIAELALKGATDQVVWDLACKEQALPITRDYHLTNAVRFDPARCSGIVFIRPGNLTAGEQTTLVSTFLSSLASEDYRGRLVSLSQGGVRIR